ncbi:MAG TPA: spore cortex biosynthesis protein YabQ [Symbiobacteriaceae bacterium]|nr:spore cortex biosynthesis protein YabQ [Symbiobacteriaceae bacterium]
MLQVQLQFYSLFMVVLCGIGMGVLYELLRVGRSYYQPGLVVGAVADLLFWVVGGLFLGAGLFAGNWGATRFYVLVSLLLGLGVYFLLASPVVSRMLWALLRFLDWLWDLLLMLVDRLVWRPLRWMVGLLLALGMQLWSFLNGMGMGLLHLLEWLFRPLVRGPYRYLRLHYLLTKRRWKRWLRHKLLGPRR